MLVPLGLTAGGRERLHRIRELLDNILQARDHLFEFGDFLPRLNGDRFWVRISSAATATGPTSPGWRTSPFHAQPYSKGSAIQRHQ